MKFTSEMLKKAKTAKTAEELLEMAKEAGVEMTAEEATKYFSDLGCEGELADEELDNVAGGSCNGYDSRAEAEQNLKTGTQAKLYGFPKYGTIVDRRVSYDTKEEEWICEYYVKWWHSDQEGWYSDSELKIS